MTCHICNGKMLEAQVTFCACNADPLTKVENVPALVCEDCGERVLSSDVVDALGKVPGSGIRYHTEPARVYDFGNIKFGERASPLPSA